MNSNYRPRQQRRQQRRFPAMYHHPFQQLGPLHHQQTPNQQQSHPPNGMMSYQFPRPTQLPDQLELALPVPGSRDVDHSIMDHVNQQNQHQKQGSGSGIGRMSEHGTYSSNLIRLASDNQSGHQQEADWSKYQPPKKLFASMPHSTSHQPQQLQRPQQPQQPQSWTAPVTNSPSPQAQHSGGSGNGEEEDSKGLNTPENLGRILVRFGLSNEDLEILSYYPDEQITLDTLPYILHDIQTNKSATQMCLHACSLCGTQCDQKKDWIDHINSADHTAACRKLRKDPSPPSSRHEAEGPHRLHGVSIGSSFHSSLKRPHSDSAKTSTDLSPHPSSNKTITNMGAEPGTKTIKTESVKVASSEHPDTPPPVVSTPTFQSSQSIAAHPVYLKGIPVDTSEQEVSDLEGSSGKINNVVVLMSSSGEEDKDEGQKEEQESAANCRVQTHTAASRGLEPFGVEEREETPSTAASDKDPLQLDTHPTKLVLSATEEGTSVPLLHVVTDTREGAMSAAELPGSSSLEPDPPAPSRPIQMVTPKQKSRLFGVISGKRKMSYEWLQNPKNWASITHVKLGHVPPRPPFLIPHEKIEQLKPQSRILRMGFPGPEAQDYGARICVELEFGVHPEGPWCVVSERGGRRIVMLTALSYSTYHGTCLHASRMARPKNFYSWRNTTGEGTVSTAELPDSSAVELPGSSSLEPDPPAPSRPIQMVAPQQESKRLQLFFGYVRAGNYWLMNPANWASITHVRLGHLPTYPPFDIPHEKIEQLKPQSRILWTAFPGPEAKDYGNRICVELECGDHPEGPWCVVSERGGHRILMLTGSPYSNGARLHTPREGVESN
ncbi:hypothetical protein LDENG_00070690 [Lucifuga dentata]|nr:hypothetical protein LDENG_00070690 [Lucifuga dentata]